MKILAWDIENSPNIVYRWGLHDQTSVPINMVEEPSRVLCFSARWVDEPKKAIRFYSDFHNGHDEMILAAWDLIDEADALLSWNGKGHDTKHINREFWLAKITPPSEPKEIDLLATARRKFKFPSNKLDYIAQAVGVGSKTVHEGFPLWKACMENDPLAWGRMRRYNEQDVHLLVDLYREMLPWITSHPNRNLYTGADGCPRCGVLNSLHPRGLRTTNVGTFQRFRCDACGGWSTSGKSIERTEIRGE
jgi:hypothetical protein